MSSRLFSHTFLKVEIWYSLKDISTDYGRPMQPFFIEIQNFWAWADKLGRLGRLGYFQPNYQHPFCYSEFLVHVFNCSIIISKKKPEPLYPHPKYLFGIGIYIWAANN